MVDKIAPNQIGQYGQLQEWLEDKDDPENKHRHVSHLWGLHPGSEITPEATPRLAEAAQTSLEFRGDGGTGWSKAWKVNFWARLKDGEHAYKLFQNLISTGTYPNMFDFHPPFQIDGNFGGVSGITEMLVQSHEGERGERIIRVLPALPSRWSAGRIKGLNVRGNFEIDLEWSEMKAEKIKVKSGSGGLCQIGYKDADDFVIKDKVGKKVPCTKINDDLFQFETDPGGLYKINVLYKGE